MTVSIQELLDVLCGDSLVSIETTPGMAPEEVVSLYKVEKKSSSYRPNVIDLGEYCTKVVGHAKYFGTSGLHTLAIEHVAPYGGKAIPSIKLVERENTAKNGTRVKTYVLPHNYTLAAENGKDLFLKLLIHSVGSEKIESDEPIFDEKGINACAKSVFSNLLPALGQRYSVSEDQNILRYLNGEKHNFTVGDYRRLFFIDTVGTSKKTYFVKEMVPVTDQNGLRIGALYNVFSYVGGIQFLPAIILDYGISEREQVLFTKQDARLH